MHTDSNDEIVHRGKWLHNLIKQSGLDVETIAAEINLDRTTVFRFLRKSNPPLKSMKKVTDILGIKLYDYFPEARILYKNESKEMKASDYRKMYMEQKALNKQLQEAIEYYKRISEEKSKIDN